MVIIAGLISSVLLVVILRILAVQQPLIQCFYLVLFGIVFADVGCILFIKDIAFWSMLPALSLDSSTRKFGTVARFGSTLGQQGVQIVVVPLVMFFIITFTGAH